MKTPDSILGIALDAREKGLVAVPCYPGTKVPMVRWKVWQALMPPLEMQEEWFGVPCNIAVLTGGVVMFDCDEAGKAALVIEQCGDTPEKVRTPRGGIHLPYRRRRGVVVQNLVKLKGLSIDIRTDGGLRLIPPSRTADGAYEWICGGLHAPEDLPLAKVGWTREGRRRRRPALLAPQMPATGPIRHPEAYCLRVRSVQGQNGSKGLVRVVCVLRDAGRGPQQIHDFIMTTWNPTCADPEWSEKEVSHAIERHCGS